MNIFEKTRIILILMMVTISNIAYAEVDNHDVNVSKIKSDFRVKHDLSLQSLQVIPKPIRLTGPQNQKTVVLPLSSRQLVSDLTLSLFVTNSISLVSRSQLAVSMNGSVIGQIPFKASQPETRVRMTIPADLLKSGYNRLTFSVAQHYSDKCEDPTAPELWSEIDTQRSQLSYSVTPRAIKPLLSNLPQLMDKRLLGTYSLTLATSVNVDDTLVESGGFIAQAAALSRDYAPISIRHLVAEPAVFDDNLSQGEYASLSRMQFGNKDVVLMGTRDEIKPWLDDETYKRAEKPLLAMYAVGEHKQHFLLIVTGASKEQMRQAASMLAIGYATLPPNSQANDDEIASMPALKRPTLVSDVKQSFSSFGFDTVTRQGLNAKEINIKFWVPADRFAKPNSEFDLHLHMAYGSGLGVQSTLDFYLNEHFEQTIHLFERQGAVNYDYRLPMPINSLEAGWNELRIKPNLLPEREGGECQPIYSDNLLLTIFEDSFFRSDEIEKLVQLPDLELLARTGYPYTGGRDDSAITLVLTSKQSGNLSAAWTLLAKLAQVNSTAINDLQSVEPAHASGNVLMVGQLNAITDNLLQTSSIGREGWLSLASAHAANDLILLDEIIGNQSIATLLDKIIGDQSLATMDVSLGDMLKNSVLVSQYESPLQTDKSILVFVSDSPTKLAEGVEKLTSDTYWSQLGLGTAILRAGSDTVLTYESAKPYLVGDASGQTQVTFIFQKYPVVGIIATILTIILFSLFTGALLKRYRNRKRSGQGIE